MVISVWYGIITVDCSDYRCCMRRAKRQYWDDLEPASGRPYSSPFSQPDNWGVTAVSRLNSFTACSAIYNFHMLINIAIVFTVMFNCLTRLCHIMDWIGPSREVGTLALNEWVGSARRILGMLPIRPSPSSLYQMLQSTKSQCTSTNHYVLYNARMPPLRG